MMMVPDGGGCDDDGARWWIAVLFIGCVVVCRCSDDVLTSSVGYHTLEVNN